MHLSLCICITKLPIVKHYRRKAALEGSQTVSSDLFAAGVQTDLSEKLVNGNLHRLSNKELLFQNLDYALDLFLIFVLTLSIFPGFLYENTGQHQLGSWYPLVLVATFNVWDLISRYIPFNTMPQTGITKSDYDLSHVALLAYSGVLLHCKIW